MATKNTQKIGWIGMGRMGFPMAERLIKAGHDVTIWNRTRAKAEPLAKIGGKVVDHLHELKDVDVLFSIVATGKDVQDVLYGKNGVCSQGGKMPPILASGSALARVRFQIVTSWPALMSRSAMGKPMRPMPIQPIFCAFFVAMFLTPMLSGAVLSQGADTATAVGDQGYLNGPESGLDRMESTTGIHAIKAATRSVIVY